MQVTEPLIKLCLAELQKQAAAMQRYKDYYEGRHEILTSYAMQDSRANRKLIFNFPRKFVDNETGYLWGKPVNYVSKSDNRQVVERIHIDKLTRYESFSCIQCWVIAEFLLFSFSFVSKEKETSSPAYG